MVLICRVAPWTCCGEFFLKFVDWLRSLIVSCQSLGALLGCFVLMPLVGMYGLRNTLMVFSNGALFLGSLFMFVSFYQQTLLFLLIGRLLVGVHTGLSTALVPMYIQELAVPSVKVSPRRPDGEFSGQPELLRAHRRVLGCGVRRLPVAGPGAGR